MTPTDLNSFLPLYDKCTKANATLVLPKSVTPKHLCIVGESLGRDEVANLDYFCGAAGRVLNKLLGECGLIRDTIHVTNVVKVQPPNNKVEDLESLGQDTNPSFTPHLTLADFLPYLREELLLVKPRVILAVGRVAMEVLTGLSGILKWRGSIVAEKLTGTDITTVVTLHPAFLMRGNWDKYVFVRHDMTRFAAFAFNLKDEMVPFSQVINPTLTEVLEFLNAIYTSSTETCIDIETVAAQRITCIGISANQNKAICIPLRHNGLRNRWTKAELIMILHGLRLIWLKPDLLKIGQNFHYDMHFLLPLIGYPREPVHDTMYMHQLIHPDAPHDLGTIMSIYTDLPYHKDEFKDWRSKDLPRDETLWEYNIKDVIGTHRAHTKLMADLTKLDLANFYNGFVAPMRRCLFDMEHSGIRVDLPERDSWIKFIEEEELPIALSEVKRLTGEEINPNSSPQIGRWLVSKGIHVPMTEKGNYSLTEDKLEELIARHPHLRDPLKAILCARVLKAKDLGTYLAAKVSPDGRMKTSFGVAVTGRLTSHANHKGEGTNLQNQPKKFRLLYLPEPGHVFVEPDLSQAEARWVAWLAKCDKLKAVFKSGQKIHKVVGSWIFNKPPDKLTPDEYFTAKRTVHGSNYKMGVNKFSTLIQKTVAEAKLVQGKYYSTVPELPAWHTQTEDTIKTKRLQTTPYGRRRIYTGMITDEDVRSGIAYVPQSGVVDTLNFGMLGLWLIKPSDIHIKSQTHDSLLFSIPVDKVDWFKPYIKLHMETLREVIINGETLVVPVDIPEPRPTWYGGD